MNRLIFFFLLAITVAGLPACTQSPDCFRKDVFCAGLVTDTLGINDNGLNQDTWLGLTQAKEAGYLDQIAHIETVDSRDGEKNILKFAEDGYDVIITIGMGLRNETLHFADLYPDSVFIGIDQADDEIRPNLISVTFPEDQAGFLAGALAARLTQTKVIGAVCETSGFDSMWRYCEGFRKGALYIDDEIKVLVKYRNDGAREKLFIDGEWGDTSARKMIRQGADVIFGAGGGTGQGALVAAAEERVYAIGAEEDQGRVLTEATSSIVTSVYGRGSYQVQETMRLIQSDKWTNAKISASIGFAPYNPTIQVSGETISEMEKLLFDLMTGTIKTEVAPSAP
ncbi:MAG: BMP family ABC transporter substrate-binding protein [Anaerolineales bacterium]|nr:BMP family ABC transporter substrate-binding protein [Anaerolineales bacterium]